MPSEAPSPAYRSNSSRKLSYVLVGFDQVESKPPRRFDPKFIEAKTLKIFGGEMSIGSAAGTGLACPHSGLREIAWPRILFVDDDPNVVAAMERNFRPYKVRLTRAYHGMQGIMSAVTEKPSVIITDISMPLASGEELIECLASNPATVKTPIVVLTGRSAVTLTARLKTLNVAAVLHKPLHFEHLLGELERLIHIARQ